MVNDPNLCSTAGELPKAKTLVASTLRKRVLGIYKITWSQVATDSDPNANDEVTNPAVLGAAALKLKRHGMDPSALRVGAPGLQMQALAAMVGPPAQLQLPGAPMLTGLGPPPASPTGQLPSGGIPNGANGVPSAPQAQQGEGPAASSAEQIMRAHLMGMQQPVAASDMVPAPNMERGVAIPLDASTLPNISEDVRESLKRGRTQFLTSEEVYNLLVAGREYNLPLSTRPYDRPLAGSMYLFDRSRTSRFRCDGYEWKRRETHAKRKVRDEFKLNCYYVGGPEDEVQRRCYWLLDDKASDLVFVHYLPPPHVRAAFGAAGEEGSDVDEAAAPLQAPTVEELPMGGGHLGAAPGGGAQGLGMGMAGPTTVLMPPQQGGQMLVEVQELPAGIGSLPMQMPPAHLLPLMSPYHQLFSMQQGNGPAAGGNAEQQAVQPTIEAVQLKDEGGGVAAGNPAQLVTQGAAPVLGRQASSGGDANAEPADGGDGKAQLRQRIAAADINDSDSMFNAMCSLHHVAGISKADRAAVCRLWMENMLDDKQKKQLFMYIANNVEDDEAVADWIKSVIRKNGG